jgi:hypothetical protein
VWRITEPARIQATTRMPAGAARMIAPKSSGSCTSARPASRRWRPAALKESPSGKMIAWTPDMTATADMTPAASRHCSPNRHDDERRCEHGDARRDGQREQRLEVHEPQRHRREALALAHALARQRGNATCERFQEMLSISVSGIRNATVYRPRARSPRTRPMTMASARDEMIEMSSRKTAPLP